MNISKYPNETEILFYFLNLIDKRLRYFCPYCKEWKATRANLKYKRIYYSKCNHYINPLKNTFMYKSKVPLMRWYILLDSFSQNPLTAKNIQSIMKLSVSQCWNILNNIRKIMSSIKFTPKGHVQIDDIFFGSPKKYGRKQKYTKDEISLLNKNFPNWNKNSNFKRRRSKKYEYKALILAAASENGEYLMVDSGVRVLSKSTLLIDQKKRQKWLKKWYKFLDENIPRGNIVYSDEDPSLGKIVRKMGFKHFTVNHSQNQFVKVTKKRIITTNAVEGLFGRFSRMVKGMHTHSKNHIQNYAKEYSLRDSEKYNLKMMLCQIFNI